jgi:hypothetical protein
VDQARFGALKIVLEGNVDEQVFCLERNELYKYFYIIIFFKKGPFFTHLLTKSAIVCVRQTQNALGPLGTCFFGIPEASITEKIPC